MTDTVGRPLARQQPDGLVIEAAAYRLRFRTDRPYATIEDADGHPWADLGLAWSIDRLDALDETIGLAPPVVSNDPDGVTVTIDVVSSAWTERRLEFRCAATELAASARMRGAGSLTTCRLFGGYYSGDPRRGTGMLRSGRDFRSVFSPEPGPLDRFAAPATQALGVDVLGGSWPGRGHWFFTPAPLCFGFSRMDASPGTVPTGPWLMVGLAVAAGEATFTGFHYEVEEEAWALRLDYEGQTTVRDRYVTPEVRFLFGAPDPYQGLVRYRECLERDDLAPVGDPRAAPDWWRGPIFCGWGAQSAMAESIARSAGLADTSERRTRGLPQAADLCTQQHYDRFLRELQEHELDPGIVVIDDRWQARYGTAEVDLDRWPDLRGWIDARHAERRRVLLWWKAWDPGGVDPALCVRRPDGVPVATDPTHPGYRALVRDAVGRLLSPEGLDGDGLKIDFTAQTPSGPGLARFGREWGIELLLSLIRLLHEAATAVKPDALMISHCVNPLFGPWSGMIRLNDALRLADPRPWKPVVPQMVHRARIARATFPHHLIDTDDWAMPDLATFREYLAVQGGLGVPVLYYTSHIDQSGEALEEQDYLAIRELWARVRPQPGEPVES